MSRRLFLPAALLAVAAVGAFFTLRAMTGEDPKRGDGRTQQGPAEDPSRIRYRAPWRPPPADQLAAQPGAPLGVLRRNDGKGFVVIRREKAARTDTDRFSRELARELKQRFPDFRPRTSQAVNVKAGEAFFFSYVRQKRGTVHSVVIVPAGARSYALNTVSPAGADDVAREIGAIVLSFDV